MTVYKTVVYRITVVKEESLRITATGLTGQMPQSTEGNMRDKQYTHDKQNWIKQEQS